ncbi:hypothetical protein LAZ67_3002186 [Cordylochernes scorpioides]|uniref:Uncharacterized protein n=1 Tax=Cordylochernes scorpioides TaxID=51811 RepID=A0ABY6KAH7_9ARAC|nr:hypothetical protein LAZ67_3002186 [Cordylochernes scorpioides]
MASADQFLAGPGPSARPRASWMLWLCQKSGIGLLREAKRHYKQRLTSRAEVSASGGSAKRRFYCINKHYETDNNKSKHQSKHWTSPGERAPKKVKTSVSRKGLQLVPHLSYSPYLAPCEFFLFPNIKKWLGGKKISLNEEVINNISGYFMDLETTYFSEDKKSEHR